jgi:acetate kinase
LNLLVLNSGSSSIKFSIFAADSGSPRSLYEGEVLGIGSGKATFSFHPSGEKSTPSSVQAQDSDEAIDRVADAVTQPGVPKVGAVGYRVVHPGPKLKDHVRITDAVLKDLEHAVLLAPLHEPPALGIIEKTMKRLPDLPHFACFDTIFHETMPKTATTYAIPSQYREQGVHRYGFHGLSCESIVEQMRQHNIPIPHRMAIAHLGSGCSVTALMDGRSVDTTMGLTPAGGVVMGTRPGDLDPGVVLYLLRQKKGDAKHGVDDVEQLLNHDCGIAALAELPNDMRQTREAAAKGNEKAQLAIDIFMSSVRKALGSFAWQMGGIDTIVFTGGIGEHDAQSRAGILEGLEGLGVQVDPSLNDSEKKGTKGSFWQISASESKTEILCIPAKEDWMIAVHVQRMLGAS